MAEDSSAAVEPEGDRAAAPAEEKPKRKPRMKAADAPAEVSAEAPQPVTVGEAAAEAPKPRRRPGRPRKAKAPEEDVPTVAPVQAGDAGAPAVDDAAPKPKRRPGRPRKAKVEADLAAAGSEEQAGPEAAAAHEADDAPKPRRRPGRPRKAKAADGEAAHDGAAASGAGASADGTAAEPAAAQETGEPKGNSMEEPPTPAPAVDGEKAASSPETPEVSGDSTAEAERRPRRKRRKKTDDAEASAKDAEQGPEQAKDQEHGKDGGKDSSRDQAGRGNKRNRDDRNRDDRDDRFGRNRRNKNRNGRNRDFNAEPSLSLEAASEMKVADLRAKAAELGIEYVGLRKPELVESVYAAAARAEGFRRVDGILEIGNEGFGWVRTGNYMEGDDDCFVHQQMIRSLGLRPGDRVAGTVGPGRGNAKYPPLIKVETVNGGPVEGLKSRPRFRDLTPVFPNERLVMEMGKDSITGRAIDLVSPIGKGQRGLIVSPPKAGKTTVLKKLCQSIAHNNPEVHLFCLLVDERPEEVTDMERSIKGEVVASTFDMPADNHTHVSELVIEHAKRLVEMGEDVVVVLDSITRLARAYNLATPASGRILSGGVDSAALYPPKKFLGAARNIENGGSLTIIASALVDTGSKMDEVIFEEFKGTGNMELKLDRELADKRIFPAIDPVSSGTRNEDLLIPADYQPFVWGIRRVLANMNNTERAANALVKGLKGTNDNREFLIKSAKKAQQTDYIA